MDITKLTSKHQTTIPLNIRKFLGLSKGDAVTFKIEDEKVVLEKARGFDIEYLKALDGSLDEWHSEEDEETFKDW